MLLQTSIDTITHAIGLAVAPVFLLTALSTLIGTLNNRLGRIIDRRRVVLARGSQPCEDATLSNASELDLLARRARLIYLAILFSVAAALLVCLVVACAFFGVLFAVVLADLLAGLFVLAMLALITSLSLFLREVFVAVFTATHANR
ncbi:MAG: DUF2721 domain-containing protein [Methyloversatilis sp.]|jgi:hypothetical protein|uniref:DUF2721 domain-containing protein n=1 Tax=Methyloversatilis universalis (strain ATCC BAA-1314 / DSM 25237 / JCM 13912 / CCUG 52030 / FAM5) TaxID=1000565 RepID=F5RCK0_METUF|nr:DUF2721 domain-containing protein [Methyloversatilis universalis]EGK71780.1 hypothetical protein METUNv1_02004 [Methyloversatilis universalis FAM5]MCP4635011.1 DUF2721 domain-containing protein [Methyloversatilis sp.]